MISSLSAIAIVWTLRILDLISLRKAVLIRSFTQNNYIIVIMILLGLILSAYFLAIRCNLSQLIRKYVTVLFIVFSPFCFFTLGQSIYFSVFAPYQDEFKEPVALQPSSSNITQRVVVLLFDETDYRLAFPERPAWISLPEFDKFKQGALSADHATSPADSTPISIAALLTGRMLDKVKTVAANNWQLTDKESRQTVSLKTATTIFSEVRKLGGNSGVAGQYPYQRILPNDSVIYYNYLYSMRSDDLNSVSLTQKMINQYLDIFPNIVSNKQFLAMYSAILKDSISLSTNPQLHMVFVHYPYPHLPNVFNIKRNNIELMSLDPRNYFGNLVLADRTLGQVRKSMEQNGVWDRTMVIVTSDHWLRVAKDFDGKEDHRVPFMVKLPGQTSGYVYRKKFNTIVTKSLVLAFFNKDFSDVTGLSSWLDKHGKPIDPVVKVNSSTFRDSWK